MDANLLSPKDTVRVSRRVRVTVFLTAWLTTLWFLVGPWIPNLHVWVAVTLLPYQIGWISLMLFVCVWSFKGANRVRATFRAALATLREEKNGHRAAPDGYVVPELVHWVFLANNKEDLDVMRASLNALACQSIGAHRICIVMAAEFADPDGRAKAATLAREFPEFRKFVCNVHVLREGECAGKSSNMSSCFRSLCAAAWTASRDPRLAHLQSAVAADFEQWHESDDARSLDTEPYTALLDRGIVTTMDADSCFHPFYLHEVERKYHFEGHVARHETIWQAPIANYMNVHRVPNLARVMCVAVSLHELASLAHPTKMKLPFSTFTMSAQLVLKAGGWASDVIADDWHMFERVFMATGGRGRVAPIYLPVVCYAVETDTWWGSVKARYTQAVRHAWASIETASFFSLWRDTPAIDRPPHKSTMLVVWKLFKLHFIGVYQTPLAISSTVLQYFLMLNGYSLYSPPAINGSIFWPVGNNFAAWLVFVALSVLVSLLPVAAILSWIANWRYENALQEVFRGAYEWSDSRNLERRLRATGVPVPALAATAEAVVPASESAPLLADVDIEVGSMRVAAISFDTAGAERAPPSQAPDVAAYIRQFMIPMAPSAWTRFKQLYESVFIVPVASFLFGFVPEFICQTKQLWKQDFKFKVAPKPTTGTTNV
jgi:hypothetical protein